LGVWAARQAITNMAVEFRDLHGSSGATIPAARLTCFNTAGTNCLGEPMHPVFAVGQGMVRALWIGIDVPVSAKGRYTGEIRLKPFGGSPTTVKVILDIDGVALADGGVSDLERLSRLKWLNSQLGMEETVIPPFTPVEAVERTVRILNREIRFNSRGLPESIVSNRREILAGPVTLVAETVAGKDALLSGKRNRTRIIKQTPATVERVTELAGDAIRCSLQSTTEFDGCILFRAILTATKPVDLKDVRLEVPVQRDVARYMMGMVKRGGLRTEKEWHWKWNIDRADNQIWLGDFDAGLQVHLRGSKDTWDLVNLRDAGLPSSWHNGGKGGCAIVETGDAVVVRAYSGPRKIDAGQTCEFVFRFLVTPFKPIDARHWNWRCGDVDGAGNIVHIHHGAPPNSYINYPFIQGRELAAAIQQIRSKPKRTSPGSLSYAAEGNLDLRRGSLHVWVTLGFDPAKGEPRHAEYNQLLFTLELPNGDGLGFYWNIDVRGLRAYVHKVSPAANPYPVMVDAPAPEWKQGESHLLTLAWDKQLAIYIDGKLRATAPYAGIAGASVEGAQLSFSGEGFLLDAIKTSDVAFSGEGAPSPAVDEHALLLDRFDRTEGKTETIPLRSHDGSHGLLAGQVAASAGPPGRRLSFASVTDPTRRNGVNLYYTVRELSDHVVEMWALRSLGNEIFTSTSTFVYSIEKTFLGQAGGGYPWLQEHLVKGYVPAWRQPLEGDVDAAIGTQGLSRWHNYYVEGLNWLMQNAGLDGLYLDGIGYDRQIMKRVARTMYHNNPDYRMNFHSGNNYEFMDHKTSPANTYMEHFPYVRDLWFGEMYNYDLPPDYWLVEISGIPFGLTSEMLNYQNGGNAYRGMVYGMGGRQHPSASAMWRLWDEFGIQEAGMIGYWDPRSPVRTGHKGVLATAYVGKGKTLIALASWAPERAECRLQLDWARLGLDPATTRWRVPQISRFQPATTLSADRAIRIEPGKGLLIWLERRESAP